MVYWLIVDSRDDGTLTSHASASEEPRPLPIMLRELEQLLGQYREKTWICVPKRNCNIARRFADSGYAVTRGLNQINRAAREIERLVCDAKLSLTQRARQRQWLQEAPCSQGRCPKPRSGEATGARMSSRILVHELRTPKTRSDRCRRFLGSCRGWLNSDGGSRRRCRGLCRRIYRSYRCS